MSVIVLMQLHSLFIWYLCLTGAEIIERCGASAEARMSRVREGKSHQGTFTGDKNILRRSNNELYSFHVCQLKTVLFMLKFTEKYNHAFYNECTKLVVCLL